MTTENMLCTTLNGYQQLANKTAIYPRVPDPETCAGINSGESGVSDGRSKEVLRELQVVIQLDS